MSDIEIDNCQSESGWFAEWAPILMKPTNQISLHFRCDDFSANVLISQYSDPLDKYEAINEENQFVPSHWIVRGGAMAVQLEGAHTYVNVDYADREAVAVWYSTGGYFSEKGWEIKLLRFAQALLMTQKETSSFIVHVETEQEVARKLSEFIEAIKTSYQS